MKKWLPGREPKKEEGMKESCAAFIAVATDLFPIGYSVIRMRGGFRFSVRAD